MIRPPLEAILPSGFLQGILLLSPYFWSIIVVHELNRGGERSEPDRKYRSSVLDTTSNPMRMATRITRIRR